MVIYQHYPVEVCEDDDGDIVATCEIFPTLCGVGDDVDEAADDLADEIADYLRRVVIH